MPALHYGPIITVGQPGGMTLPTGEGIGATQEACMLMSLARAAGLLPMSTVNEPRRILPGPPGTQPGSMQGMVLLPSVAAGMLPIITVKQPSMMASGRPGWGTGVGTGAGG